MMRTILSLMSAAASIAIFTLYVQPTYDDAKATQASIAQYDQALARATELQKLKQHLFSRFNSFEPAAVERLHKLLPDHVDNVRLVLDLDSMAARHRMAIQNVVVNAGVKAEGQNPTIGSTVSPLKYDSITLKFSTDGTYPDFMTFLEELEKGLRIVDVVALNIGSGPLSPLPEPLYHYDITIRTYWLK